MTRDQIANWVAAYERAWRAAGTSGLGELFAPDAVYRQGPYNEPALGLPAICRMWEAKRDGPDEVFRMTRDIVAVEGTTAVIRVEVRYGEPIREEFRDLWVMRFTDEGLCSSFEEWPFAPEPPDPDPDPADA